MKAAAEARWGPEKKAAPKNLFAVGLAQMRWEKLTPEERKEELARVRKQRGKPKKSSGDLLFRGLVLSFCSLESF